MFPHDKVTTPMTTSKPTIFLSHSSRDEAPLIRLKSILVRKTGDTVEFFLSSDGQSIQLGRNWVHKVEDALTRAKIAFVFLTPTSIMSKWLYFESGFSYSKGIRVIPVAIQGLDLQNVPPPLSLLQGFNIHDHEGLNNILHIINEEFQFRFEDTFTAEDYSHVFHTDESTPESGLAAYVPFIHRLEFTIRHSPDASLQLIKEHLIQSKLEVQEDKHGLHSYGVTFTPSNDVLNVMIDPTFISQTFPIVQAILQLLDPAHGGTFAFELFFARAISRIHEHYRLTSKIFGSGISLGPTGAFLFGNLEFKFKDNYRIYGTQVTVNIISMQITMATNELSASPLVDLLTILFDREILFTRDVS